MKTLERPSFEGKKKEDSGYNAAEIAELEQPMMELVGELKQSIDNGEYDTLVSDDTSARIPTLILREVFKARMGGRDLKTYFVAGGFNLKENKQQELLREFFNKIRSVVGKKALLVTEYIGSGGSVRRITESMSAAGINFDVAAATMRTVSNDPWFAEQQEENLKEIKDKHKLFFGAIVPRVPSIWSGSGSSGVSKSMVHESVHPEAVRPGPYGPMEDPFAEAKKEAREDVKLMAKRILEKVWEQS